jgi:hypothetical protein
VPKNSARQSGSSRLDLAGLRGLSSRFPTGNTTRLIPSPLALLQGEGIKRGLPPLWLVPEQGCDRFELVEVVGVAASWNNDEECFSGRRASGLGLGGCAGEAAGVQRGRCEIEAVHGESGEARFDRCRVAGRTRGRHGTDSRRVQDPVARRLSPGASNAAGITLSLCCAAGPTGPGTAGRIPARSPASFV